MSTEPDIVDAEVAAVTVPPAPAAPDREHAAAREYAPVRRTRPTDELAARPASADLQQVARTVHRSLRGRYVVTVLLALLLGAGGAALGWQKVRPVYRSEGLLRIAYQMPEVMQETDQNAPMQMFDAFMLSQRLLITSRRVIDMAVQDPIWNAANRRLPDRPDRYFAEHLDVDIKQRSEFIQISVRDEDPGTAAAAVTAVINAYTELYNSQEKQMERQRTGVLEDRQTFLQGRVEQLTQQVMNASQAFGTSDLSRFYDAAVARAMRLEATINEFEFAMATSAGQARASTRPVARTEPRIADTDAAIRQAYAQDPELRRLYAELAGRDDELRRLAELGYGDSHRQVQAARREVERARGRVSEYENFAREFYTLTGRGMNEQGRAQVADKTPEQLKADLDRLTTLYASAKAEMINTGKQQLHLQSLQEELRQARDQHSELTRRAAVLRTEGSLGGRLSVISSGEIPLSPARDTRTKFTAAGGAAGLLLGTAAMVGLGFLRTRVDYADESSNHVGESASMLGILPDLSRPDPTRWAAAAHSVHQIRVLLQTQAARRGSGVHLITSSTSGEGKTSFALALAMSAAASGTRTLLIDCDFVGRHLTAGLEAEHRPGLRDALAVRAVGKNVFRLRKHLHVMSTGRIYLGDAASIPTSRIKAVIADARKHYDMVVIDTGPVLGSLEAAVLSGVVDSAIMMVTKGQRHDLVRHSMQRMRTLGLTTAGFVYNRASAGDFDRSPMGSTSSSRVLSVPRPLPGPVSVPTATSMHRFGPLVQAVEAEMNPEPVSPEAGSPEAASV